MKLAVYLKHNSLTVQRFGELIGRTGATVSRLARSKHRPDWDTVAAIEKATGGAVTANDFAQSTEGEAA